MSHYAIEISSLEKIYPESEIPAVYGLTLQIKPGEIFGLLGPNGAGKTTTFSILCGLLDFNHGLVKVGGYDVRKNMKEVKKIIGVVPQDLALFPTLTAYENLEFFGNFYGLSGKKLDKTIRENLEKFGLSSAGSKQVNSFSGGMKRRLNLIAGILHHPAILFLDEPTAAVDVQSRSSIMHELREMNRRGTTIVYTSHLMDEAQQFCSKVGIIDHGKLVEQGHPDELLNRYPACGSLEEVFLKITGKRLRD
ncbi:MAG: ABC transporter ATP-binding protein [Bacteroidia bacterium]|nr:ABC transporter ATP-binding protein [Bacteroidia bacterium]